MSCSLMLIKIYEKMAFLSVVLGLCFISLFRHAESFNGKSIAFGRNSEVSEKKLAFRRQYYKHIFCKIFEGFKLSLETRFLSITTKFDAPKEIYSEARIVNVTRKCVAHA